MHHLKQQSKSKERDVGDEEVLCAEEDDVGEQEDVEDKSKKQ